MVLWSSEANSPAGNVSLEKVDQLGREFEGLLALQKSLEYQTERLIIEGLPTQTNGPSESGKEAGVAFFQGHRAELVQFVELLRGNLSVAGRKG